MFPALALFSVTTLAFEHPPGDGIRDALDPGTGRVLAPQRQNAGATAHAWPRQAAPPCTGASAAPAVPKASAVHSRPATRTVTGPAR